ncbi:ATP-dependent DNA helicase DinG [Kineosphaera limosa]|nr:ATP-dependent DNA helicase DinG [Kineosphaera limosa]
MPADRRRSGDHAALDALLERAVAGIGGTPREGQVRMAHAVADAVDSGEHLLVQAGTGTGKSLAYLVPAIAHAQATGQPVIVATATLALQAQIVDRDLPRLADALAPRLPRRPTYALVKGRRNYVCQHKLAGGYPADDDDALLSFGAAQASSSRLGAEVARLREWAGETDSGDRDELVPGVSERAWRQVSVSAHECLGGKCPMVAECFVERARADAADVDVIVTNHSFMAIDAFEDRAMLPEHDLLIIDEAHELVDRVTSTITDELSAGTITAAAKRCGKLADTADLSGAADHLEAALATVPEGRLEQLPEQVALGLASALEAARAVQSQIKGDKAAAGEADGAKALAKAAVDEVFEVTERLLDGRDLDVTWLSRDQRRGTSALRVAPMSVAMLVRDKIFGERTVVLTSATLELGGTFDAVAGTIGLRGESAPAWTGLDVGSPFDYARQAIAYVAAKLPPPGRDGTAPESLDELEALVRAAGGRTLGLFSSMRAAQAATEAMRDRLGDDWPVLCQGEDQIATLVREFARDARTCLFGTLTLWQGVDVPGSACQLVVIDRIPFPRPDDPLASARSRAIASMGGNGFMAVSATHAALRLAQGAGRLVRRADDRGVVAFLDPRMITARYAGFLQASLPPFWPTTDRKLVLGALTRLDESAAPPLPVADPRPRGRTVAPPAAAPTGEHPEPPTSESSGAGESPGVIATGAPAPVSSRTAVVDGHAWDEEADEALREAGESGVDAETVAEHLDLPVEVVQARGRQLGLEFTAEVS